MTNASMFDIVQEDMTLDDDSRYPFYEIACDKPRGFYNPHKDVFLVYFVLVCPLETNIYHVQRRRVLTIVQLDRNHSQLAQFQIRYWRLGKGKKMSNLKHYKRAWAIK